jgi:exodeoxyribonuclease-3
VAALTICSWNVNGIRSALKGGHLQAWLQATAPDIAGFQEVKATPDQLDGEPWTDLGYRSWWHPAQRAGYSGALLLSKPEPLEVRLGLGIERFDIEGRVIQADYPEFTLLTSYYPNAGRGEDRLAYKFEFYEAFLAHVNHLRGQGRSLVFMGDFNIAPEDRDVHDPSLWAGQVLVSEEERARFRALLDLGLKDAFRLFDQPEGSFTWWDYRMGAFRRNLGLRIDHILLSPPLAERCRACQIDLAPRRLKRPSDHAPVIAELD